MGDIIFNIWWQINYLCSMHINSNCNVLYRNTDKVRASEQRGSLREDIPPFMDKTDDTMKT